MIPFPGLHVTYLPSGLPYVITSMPFEYEGRTCVSARRRRGSWYYGAVRVLLVERMAKA